MHPRSPVPSPPSAGAAAAPDVRRPAGPALIELRDVSRVYRLDGLAVAALSEVNLTVQTGEFVVVLGPSGSGKTTLLNLIGGLDAATGGEIRVAGQAVTGASRGDLAKFRRRTTSFIFQTFNLFPGLTALENVEFGADAAGRKDAAAIARQRLDEVGPGGPDGPLPAPALRRRAAARGHRPRPGHRQPGAAR